MKISKLIFCALIFASILISSLISLIQNTNPNFNRGLETTKLIEATKQNDLEGVRTLLAAGHAVNEKNTKGGTALHYASAADNVDIVKLLLSYGADPLIEDNDKYDSIEINLLNHGVDTSVLKLLVPNKDLLDSARSRGDSYLLYSINPSSSFEKSKFFVEMGDDVNFRSSYGGKFPLLYAAGEASDKLVGLLIAQGADPNMSDFDGQTALMAACRNRQSGIVEILLRSGANPSATDKSGATAIDFLPAGENNIVEIIRRWQNGSKGNRK